MRLLKSPLVREMQRVEFEEDGAEKIEKLGEGSLMRAVVYGDRETGSFMAGQCACMLDKVQPAADIVRELFDVDRIRSVLAAAAGLLEAGI